MVVFVKSVDSNENASQGAQILALAWPPSPKVHQTWAQPRNQGLSSSRSLEWQEERPWNWTRFSCRSNILFYFRSTEQSNFNTWPVTQNIVRSGVTELSVILVLPHSDVTSNPNKVIYFFFKLIFFESGSTKQLKFVFLATWFGYYCQ